MIGGEWSHAVVTFTLRATSHTRLRARDHHNTSGTLFLWWIGRSWSKFKVHFTLDGPTEGVCECKMDIKSTWTPAWHRLDHVSWSLGSFSKNHFLEVRLTQNRETMALRMFIIVDLFYFIMREDPHE